MNVNIPNTPFLDPKTGKPSQEWLLFLLTPYSNNLNQNTIAPTAGGTGTNTKPTNGQLLIGNGTSQTYNVASITTTTGLTFTVGPGTLQIDLKNIINQPGRFGDGADVPVVDVNAQGQVTGISTTPVAINANQVTGGTFTIDLGTSGKFGCNGNTVQAKAASGGAVAGTASTNVGPYGYTTSAQADGIVTLLNNIRAALVANGIMS